LESGAHETLWSTWGEVSHHSPVRARSVARFVFWGRGPKRSVARFVLLALLLAAAASCGGSQLSAEAAVAQQAATSQARLVAGPWRLADYRPDVALEPMLKALLAQQVRSMVVRFDGRTLSAQSPTVQLLRPYALDNITGLAFSLVSPDIQGGGPVRSRCEISDDGRRITFHAETEPWTGTGALEREGP
jgi:hypothetical protein